MEIQEIFRSKGREVELLRELDVLIERWDEVRQSQDLSLKEALLNERLEEEQRILGLLSSGQTKKELIEGKEFLLSCLNETDWAERDGVYHLDERLFSWYRFALENLWKMKDFKLSHIHRIRLKSKKYRYVAEIFEDHVS